MLLLDDLTMPRSVQDILDHADELAHRFAHLGPNEASEIPVEGVYRTLRNPYMLRFRVGCRDHIRR